MIIDLTHRIRCSSSFLMWFFLLYSMLIFFYIVLIVVSFGAHLLFNYESSPFCEISPCEISPFCEFSPFYLLGLDISMRFIPKYIVMLFLARYGNTSCHLAPLIESWYTCECGDYVCLSIYFILLVSAQVLREAPKRERRGPYRRPGKGSGTINMQEVDKII